MGVRIAELTYEQKDPYDVGSNEKGTLLGHYLLAVE